MRRRNENGKIIHYHRTQKPERMSSKQDEEAGEKEKQQHTAMARVTEATIGAAGRTAGTGAAYG